MVKYFRELPSCNLERMCDFSHLHSNQKAIKPWLPFFLPMWQKRIIVTPSNRTEGSEKPQLFFPNLQGSWAIKSCIYRQKFNRWSISQHGDTMMGNFTNAIPEGHLAVNGLGALPRIKWQIDRWRGLEMPKIIYHTARFPRINPSIFFPGVNSKIFHWLEIICTQKMHTHSAPVKQIGPPDKFICIVKNLS